MRELIVLAGGFRGKHCPSFAVATDNLQMQ